MRDKAQREGGDGGRGRLRGGQVKNKVKKVKRNDNGKEAWEKMENCIKMKETRGKWKKG